MYHVSGSWGLAEDDVEASTSERTDARCRPEDEVASVGLHILHNLSTRFVGLFFFFQAEDGIRDLTLTGVQTCALPISNSETWTTELSRARLRTATSPVSGLTRPARISISVDFPEPFGPIRPMRSPSETVKEMLDRKSVV